MATLLWSKIFQANDVYLRRYSSTKNNPPKLGLSFPLTSNHFVNNNNRVQLKCLASIANFYWKSAEVTLLQEKPKFASVMTSGDDVQVEKAGKMKKRKKIFKKIFLLKKPIIALSIIFRSIIPL